MISLELSKEQEQLILLAKQGHNVLVDACIGSGKTTTIQALCNQIKDRNILYLTYNKLLKLDAKDKILGKNVTVQNYHGYAYMTLSKIGVKVGISDLIQEFIRQKPPTYLDYALLIIDEYQDIDCELAELLWIIKEQNPNIQIIAVGVMCQKIYDKTTLNVPQFIQDFLGSYELITFTQCFRLSKDIATTLGNIWNKEIIGVNENCIVETKSVEEIIPILVNTPTKDILCLGARTGTMARVLNHLESNYPNKFNKRTVYASIRNNDSGGANPSNKVAFFTTYDSSKGLERNTCIVFDYTYAYWLERLHKPDVAYTIMRNIFCVASSRGKNHIIFVKADTPLLTEENLKTEIATNKEYSTFVMSEMFDFKYKEDIESCYSLLKIKEIDLEDKSVIDIKGTDGLIDISPCIGQFQETYFTEYDIESDIKFLMDLHKDRPQINLSKNNTVEYLILALTSYETRQDRYRTQVTIPYVTEKQKDQIFDRLSTVFSTDEMVQVQTEMSFKYEGHDNVKMVGRADVVKDSKVYELKFVSELQHEHFLQCAMYMVSLGLKESILWNVKNNKMYSIKISSKKKFLDAVVNTITKGTIKTYKKA